MEEESPASPEPSPEPLAQPSSEPSVEPMTEPTTEPMTELSPKESPKLSPPSSPKFSPKLSPKVSPKLRPKLIPKDDLDFRSAFCENDIEESEETEKIDYENEEKILVESLKQKYQKAEEASEEFVKLVSQGDLQMIYRNRSCWSFQSSSNLTQPALNVWKNVPASRQSVMEFVGFLIHETTNATFSKRENPQYHLESTAVRDAACQLLDMVTKYTSRLTAIPAIVDVLTWICGVASALSQLNGGRPLLMGKGPEALLEMMLSCEPVNLMIRLLCMAINTLLRTAPDACMKTLFDASRFGAHFNWVWLHIARTFPATIIAHLLTTGSDQFKIYVDEINNKKKTNAAAAVISAIHVEYQTKFLALSDVFNFLMRRNSPEMQELVTKMLKKSLHSGFSEKGCADISFTFFFKLVVCSIETLRILLSQNIHLVTPQNMLRAIRQVSSVDQGIVLPTKSYSEFLGQVVEVLDAVSFGAVFESLVRVVYDEPLVKSFSVNEKFSEEFKPLKITASSLLDTMVGRLLRVAHAPGPQVISAEYPAINAFAHGSSLQFLVDAAFELTANRSSLVVRQLHAISIAYGELKSAEIVARFLYSLSQNNLKYIYILVSYLTTTTKFQPSIMEVFYKEFHAIRALVEISQSDSAADLWTCRQNLAVNLWMLLEWDGQVDDANPIAYLRLHPGEHFSNIVNTILSDTLDDATRFLEEGSYENAMTSVKNFYRLLGSFNGQISKVYMTIPQMHRFVSQLAMLLKMTLFGVSKDNPGGLATFNELKTCCMQFLFHRQFSKELTPFVRLFVDHLVKFLFEDSVRLFGESWEPIEPNPMEEFRQSNDLELVQLETGPSVIDAIRNLNVDEKPVTLAHSGSLKSRHRGVRQQNGGQKEEDKETLQQRSIVVLDALRAMCKDVSRELQLINSKSLAICLTESLCPNAVLADYKFDEWDLEVEVFPRYVQVNNRVESSLLADGLLRILADTDSFAYCLPIMKAQLVTILVDIQSTADRSIRINERTRQRLYRWMTLTSRGRLIHQRFTFICDIETFSTPFETFILLLEVWRFFQRRAISPSVVDAIHTELQRGEIAELPGEKEAVDGSTATFRQILHRHIAKGAHLFQKVFPAVYDSIKLSASE